MVCHILWLALEECLRCVNRSAASLLKEIFFSSSKTCLSSLAKVGTDYWKGTLSLLYSSAGVAGFLFGGFVLFFPKEKLFVFLAP